ncbi:MAG: hypothetical protein PVH03_01070, partial [Chloroflexota bacterium]
MSQTGYTRFLITTIAVVLVTLAIGLGWFILRGDSSLLRNVNVEHTLITPNADGNLDATPLSYELSRNATVSIFLADEEGQRYYFRQEQPRGVGEYQVLFSGVVEGYELPGENIEGQILARLLQDGDYTWTITAVDDNGVEESISGPLTIAEADDQLPEIRNFSLDKRVFSPNQDGID